MIRDDLEMTSTHWLMIALAVTTGGIHLYVGATTGSLEFLVLGAGLLAGLVVFFTRLFRPVLYLVGAIYVTVLLVVWLLQGVDLGGLALVDKLVQVALVVVFVVLLYQEETAAGTEGRRSR